jgi:hypothetical protein
MFSVQQKRDISTAVQRILRDTAHPELPTTGEITFTLKVVGAESWSWAEIANNAAVGDPGVNPHNELMAELPEEKARELIDEAQSQPYAPVSATPEEFMKEMITHTCAALRRDVTRLEDRDKIKDSLYAELTIGLEKVVTFLTPIMEDNLIQHHSDQLQQLMTAIKQLGTGVVK